MRVRVRCRDIRKKWGDQRIRLYIIIIHCTRLLNCIKGYGEFLDATISSFASLYVRGSTTRMKSIIARGTQSQLVFNCLITFSTARHSGD